MTLLVTGQAEPGSTVTVTFPDGTTATGTANDQGNFTIDIPTGVELEGGEEILATATDDNGNTSKLLLLPLQTQLLLTHQR